MAEAESKHVYKKIPAWEILSNENIKQAFDFSEPYKRFLSEVKTER